MADLPAIKVTEFHTERTHHFSAHLSYKGAVFQVFDKDGCASWPTCLEAMRAADDYRANRFHVPSDEILAGLADIANDYDRPMEWVAAHVRENGLDAAWRRR